MTNISLFIPFAAFPHMAQSGYPWPTENMLRVGGGDLSRPNQIYTERPHNKLGFLIGVTVIMNMITIMTAIYWVSSGCVMIMRSFLN